MAAFNPYCDKDDITPLLMSSAFLLTSTVAPWNSVTLKQTWVFAAQDVNVGILSTLRCNYYQLNMVMHKEK